MKTNILKVGYHLVRNGTSTADRAPYLGVAVPVGSLAYGNILQRMLDKGTHMTLATATYFLNELYEFAAEVIADDIVRINMGAVSLYPMIGGPFDSEDDAFRAPRNTLYVGATLSQEIRDAVSGIAPVDLGADPANGTVKISTVMDLASETYRLIDGLNEFRIAGIDLTVPDGEDESLTLVAADGVTKVADIAVVRTDDGQRIVCTLAAVVPAGTYHVRLVSHGLDPTAPLVTVLYRVAVKGVNIPAPTITGGHSQGFEADEGKMHFGSAFILEGTNLGGAAVRLQYTAASGTVHDDPVAAQDVTVNEDGTSLTIALDATNPAVSSTQEGDDITVVVTTAGGTAEFDAESAGDA